MPQVQLFDNSGNRKYLTPEERTQFKSATGKVSKDKRMFALMLFHTGCRISEGLNIETKHLDFSTGCVTIHSLKRRKQGIYRQVPLSDEYLQALDDAYDLRMLQKKGSRIQDKRLWTWSRRHGYEVIKEIMAIAEINGIHAVPKGLRHAFAIACIDKDIALNMVQKWMGHASMETTAIYANAQGRVERKIASKLWE
jgi:integrase/recombinase XerD